MDLGTGWGPAAAEYFYRLAYVPNKPEEGKCYNIKVKVDRHFAVVYATDQYCYTTNLATDPLDGTKFGKSMETDVNSDKKASIPLSAQAGFFYTNAQSARVDLVLEFPWNRLEHRFLRTDLVASIGVLGMVYKKDRTLATRFSDFGCCSSGTRWFMVLPTGTADSWASAWLTGRNRKLGYWPPQWTILRETRTSPVQNVRPHDQWWNLLTSRPHSAPRGRRPGTFWLKASEVRCSDGAAPPAVFPHR
jgi:hypothetical protein